MEKSFWQKFNPSLKEMMDKNPNLTILGIWWAWYWRIAILSFIIAFVIAVAVILSKFIF